MTLHDIKSRAERKTMSLTMASLLLIAVAHSLSWHLDTTHAASIDVQEAVEGGLDWLAANQSRRGNWTANEGRYPTAMTALAGTALLLEGSTPTPVSYTHLRAHET